MPKDSDKQLTRTAAAVKDLRSTLQLTQQQLANLLRLSVTAIARYEIGLRTPEPAVLARLGDFAAERGLPELAQVFHSGLTVDLRPESVVHTESPREYAFCATVLQILRQDKYGKTRLRLFRLLLPVASDLGLAGQMFFDEKV